MLGSELTLPGYSFAEALGPGDFIICTIKYFPLFLLEEPSQRDKMVDMFLIKSLTF